MLQWCGRISVKLIFHNVSSFSAAAATARKELKLTDILTSFQLLYHTRPPCVKRLVVIKYFIYRLKTILAQKEPQIENCS